MLSQFAFAKLQSIHGQQHFIHNLPALITSKRCKEWSQICGITPVMDPKASQKNFKNKNQNKVKAQMPECLAITNIFSTFPMHAIIFYDQKSTLYKILPFTAMKINDKSAQDNQDIIQEISQSDFNIFDIIQKYSQTAITLSPISKIMILSDQQKESQVYYFCLPSTTHQRVSNSSKNNNLNLSANNVSSTNQSMLSFSMLAPIQSPPITNGSKWSNDDRELLKKLLLLYGYGRWKSINRASASLCGKLHIKSLDQVKAYSNSFLRSLGLQLPQQQTNLKIFLQKLIEEHNQQFQQYQPNIRQWDQYIQVSQRSVQYTKRLQLLSRLKSLIRKYRQQQLKKMSERDLHKVDWDSLLNFIPLTLLFGQRPAPWWTKKHDVDLLLGIYKYGYANYTAIRGAKQYCFLQLQKSHTYQDFPVADNLTRRLKKLVNTIVKIQQNQGVIDFDDQAESQEDEKNWTDEEKKTLFSILGQFGVPLTNDNKSNWNQLKDKMKNQIKQFSKTPNQLQKMVSRLRWNSQQIAADNKLKDQVPSNTTLTTNIPFKIDYEQAKKFCRNVNIFEFIRKTIFVIQQQNFKIFIKECEQKSQQLPHNHPAYIQHIPHHKKSHKQADPAAQDKQGNHNLTIDHQILNHINKNGLVTFNLGSIKLNDVKLTDRMDWQIQIYRQVKQKINEKKKKFKTPFDQSTKKRSKFEIIRDKEGNIKFPININPSLTLHATGRISSQPNYHSQHNLFPIGYVSERTHMSMFNRGVRVKYTCEILQGDGRPIYKVTSEQDPAHPIIRDSSTGCWVYICQRVNNLQDNKKQKVTISGTQRFGLLQNNVIRLLQDLPDADKCVKYKFKKHLIDGNRQG